MSVHLKRGKGETMDYSNSNAYVTGGLAMTGLSLTGYIWVAVALVAIGTACFCVARFLPRKEN